MLCNGTLLYIMLVSTQIAQQYTFFSEITLGLLLFHPFFSVRWSQKTNFVLIELMSWLYNSCVTRTCVNLIVNWYILSNAFGANKDNIL